MASRQMPSPSRAALPQTSTMGLKGGTSNSSAKAYGRPSLPHTDTQGLKGNTSTKPGQGASGSLPIGVNGRDSQK